MLMEEEGHSAIDHVAQRLSRQVSNLDVAVVAPMSRIAADRM